MTKMRDVVPEVEERLILEKRRVPTGGVRVRTIVHEDTQIVDEPLGVESVEVERVRLDGWVEAPVPVREEGDATIITIVEEVLVVERRLRAVEEVRVTRRKTERRDRQEVTLRRQEAVVERLEKSVSGEGSSG
jgi:stress response protein YsnF